ncbi:FxSxx-COOH system tetratricopeptide repeat protein [Plantactinospora soyae]|uniref:Cellulose biosynthesis protein BcsQ/tetratricopeptide (TPR) repeat protein n=1 Tax=Plantactinospora soyae TaxID=1544732 RepID=A0A927M532_9ACTN|nr:FxSxx-COOH system tetratricopeptide repeat protein [Plantactinospora soyae]MBE1486965.1 cellulose biosynthesis protein BcsQ/tetratricopeptide (TPR) repeat protein [Plantactinospora soyae]
MSDPEGVRQHAGRIITFYSYKGGTGRTMALANIAWLLANNGHRVLTIDWDLESPGLHRYLHPFLVDKELRGSHGVIDLVREYAKAATRPAAGGSEVLHPDEVSNLARIQRYASSLEFPFPNDGGIDLVPAGRQGPEYSTRVSTFNWDDFYDRLGGAVFLDALREDLRSHYDYVLIDSRTGLSDTAGICTVLLPDVLVNCFTMSTQSIQGAVSVARSIRNLRRGQPIRIFPVPTRVEDGEQTKLERSRTHARQLFEPFVRALDRQDSDKYWGSVEIPYKVYYAYEEILAAFGDRPRQEGTLLAAYERLAGIVVGSPIELPITMPETRRLRWLADFERRAPLSPGELVISYAPRDRIWAEWVAAELSRVSQQSRLVEQRASMEEVDRADRILVLLSQEYTRSREAARLWRRGQEREYDGPGRFVVPIRFDATPTPAMFEERDVVELHGVSGMQARESLLAALDLMDVSSSPGAGEGQTWPRFPAALPPIWRVPARNPAFTGRDAIVEMLRNRLHRHPTAQPLALLGLGGVGKTQIALEYAHRFAAYYDIVWWISADQPQIVRAELAKLAGQMKLAGSTVNEQVDAVLQALRQGSRFPRWLIIFDNPEEPEQIRDFLPDGPGDVIVTTRNQSWTHVTEYLEIGVFERAESVELISRRVQTLMPSDAEAVAERLGDLPLVVEQAAAWLATTAMPVRSYLNLLDTRLPEMLAERPPQGYPNSAAVTWSLSMERLRESRPAAARLLELFSFFSPEPIPTWLLSTPRMVEELAKVDRAMRDPLLHGALIQDIGRYALARVDPAINAIRVHRLVQTVIRDAMSVEARVESRVQVQEILAATSAARQGGVDDRENWSTYEELRPHLEPSGALESRDDAVRQLVLDMVRYLRLRGDLAGSEELAEAAVKQWSTMFDTEDALALRLRVQLANTLRDVGRSRESLAISEEVLPRLTELLGPDHFYTLEAAGGLAADYWLYGRYREATTLNQQGWARWRSAYGDDHFRTLMAANNAAAAERFNGRYREAFQIDTDNLRRRRKVLGERDYWTLHSAVALGRDMRALGDLEQSRALLTNALRDCQVELGDDNRLSLWAAKSLAVTLRRMGRPQEAVALLDDTLRRSQKTFGERHPETMQCLLESACLHSALDDQALARQQVEDVLAYFRETYGADNPLTLGAANDLGMILLRTGDAEAALPILEETAEQFADVLGDDHPFTLACRLNLANARHATGSQADARRLDERTQGKLVERLGRQHPTTIAATSNLAISLRDTGALHDARQQTQKALEFSRQVLGDEHPNTIAVRDGHRIKVDIELEPL